jgi:hypothetical protein
MEEDEDKDQISVLRRQMVSMKMYGFYLAPNNKTQIHEKEWHSGLRRKIMIVDFHLAYNARFVRVFA